MFRLDFLSHKYLAPFGAYVEAVGISHEGRPNWSPLEVTDNLLFCLSLKYMKASQSAIIHRRDRRERGEFLFPVTPDSDPGSRISPQMTHIRRPKMALSVSSAVQFSNGFLLGRRTIHG
jgi:hypothetical protein